MENHDHQPTASPGPAPVPSETAPAAPSLLGNILCKEPLYWLLLAVPVACVLEWVTHGPPVALFIVSCIAIVPLAGLMGRATENLAETLGAGIGGFLNATFGNAAELIIALIALANGKYDLVKYSITGSIIGNILLVLGLSILCGGLKYQKQVFNRTAASMGTTLLALACVGLVMPTMYWEVLQRTHANPEAIETVNLLSEEIAAVLAGAYVLSLIFSLRTHQHLFAGHEEQLPTTGEHHQPEWSRQTALLVLLVSTVGVAGMSEFLVGSVDEAAKALKWSNIFVGVIVVAVIGNAAEHSTAVLVAMKDKMDLAVHIAVGSSLQIALFVAPVLVFASIFTGHGILDLHFTPLEFLSMVASVGVLALISVDGETHWMEGAMLLAVYIVVALAFYNLGKYIEPMRATGAG